MEVLSLEMFMEDLAQRRLNYGGYFYHLVYTMLVCVCERNVVKLSLQQSYPIAVIGKYLGQGSKVVFYREERSSTFTGRT